VGYEWDESVQPSISPYIIGPSRQEWDMSGMRVYNQAFLLELFWAIKGYLFPICYFISS
jgi:hypothetical protein